MKMIMLALVTAIVLGLGAGALSAIPDADANPCARNPAVCR